MKSRKLKLSKITIRTLSAANLQLAAGGQRAEETRTVNEVCCCKPTQSCE
jgi:hypothetical protein